MCRIMRPSVTHQSVPLTPPRISHHVLVVFRVLDGCMSCTLAVRL